jgi:C-terminal processing protease CtpA/Prc
MRNRCIVAWVLMTILYSGGARAAEQPRPQPPSGQSEEGDLHKGVIGVSLQVGAERVGDPAVLYVAMVHPEGPAHQAGLTHGDEILTVDGTPVAGKSYEQIVRMIRGAVGTAAKVGVKGAQGTRELTMTRVAADTLSKGPSGPHRNPSR